jgi:hypothetical protein
MSLRPVARTTTLLVGLAALLLPSLPVPTAGAAQPATTPFGRWRLSVIHDPDTSNPTFQTWNSGNGDTPAAVATNGGSTITFTAGRWTITMDRANSAIWGSGVTHLTGGEGDEVSRVTVSHPAGTCPHPVGDLEITELVPPTSGSDIEHFTADLDITCGTRETVFLMRVGTTTEPAEGIHPATRIAGATRVETAVFASTEQFPAAGAETFLFPQADTAVIARADQFADALAGGPLAVAKHGPLLLTPPDALAPAVLQEVDRILPEGTGVYVLGGTQAISTAVEDALIAAGHPVHRLAGVDRYTTAVAIAREEGSPTRVFLVTGRNFPDGLAAGACAAAGRAAILLTDDATLPQVTLDYVADTGKVPFAIGGPAAQAWPNAIATVGADRYETSAKLADACTTITSPDQTVQSIPVIGIASGENFPDALTGSAHIGRWGGPLVLVKHDSVPASVATVIAKAGDWAYIYGGEQAISNSAFQ